MKRKLLLNEKNTIQDGEVRNEAFYLSLDNFNNTSILDAWEKESNPELIIEDDRMKTLRSLRGIEDGMRAKRAMLDEALRKQNENNTNSSGGSKT